MGIKLLLSAHYEHLRPVEGLGTFLRYNKRLWLLPLAGVGLFLVRGFWLPYAKEALRLLMKLFGLYLP